jgi:hypothetical protein
VTPRAPATAAQCFGAAARDPSHPPCPGTPGYVPRPGQPDPGAPCQKLERDGLIEPCAFGVPEEQASRRFALIGDSHAAHLRSAFAVVAREQGWRGYEITRDSCAYVPAGRPIPEPYFSQCVEFKQQIPTWLERHPEVSTVFVVGLTRDAGTPQDPFETKVAGYIEAWNRLPPSVRQIVVIRDTPELQDGTLACVNAAVARRQPPDDTCAVPRSIALAPDPAEAAATQLDTSRVQVIDLTRFFCDDGRCFPVIGGVLAYKDITHLSPTFAATLGPFLLADVRRLSAAWAQ